MRVQRRVNIKNLIGDVCAVSGFLSNHTHGCSWGGGRVELQAGFFIVGSLRQHPEPDEMVLVRPLKGERGTVLIIGAEALRMPMESRHALADGLERLHIQREAWHHDGAIMVSTDEF